MTRAPRGLAAALTVSVALHLAAAVAWLAVRDGAPSVAHEGAAALQVRVVPGSFADVGSQAPPPAVPPRAVDSERAPDPAPDSAPPRSVVDARARRERPAAATVEAAAPAASAAPTPAPAPPTGLPPAPDYRAAAGLDPPPQPLADVVPEYPEAAGLQEGAVVLRLLINAEGGVDDVGIVRATPPGLFEAAAMQAFAQARFAPGRFLGVPVKSQMTIEVRFTPLNRGDAVGGRSY